MKVMKHDDEIAVEPSEYLTFYIREDGVIVVETSVSDNHPCHYANTHVDELEYVCKIARGYMLSGDVDEAKK